MGFLRIQLGIFYMLLRMALKNPNKNQIFILNSMRYLLHHIKIFSRLITVKKIDYNFME